MACWSKITAPILCLEGRETGSIVRLGLDDVEQRRRRQALRSFREEHIAGDGHMLHKNRPDEVERQIGTFPE